MTDTDLPAARERRPIDDLLGSYADDHRNPTNQAIHWVCVPLIVWSALAALWTIPVPTTLLQPGAFAGLAMFLALQWYLKLSRTLGLAMLVAFVVLGYATHLLFVRLGTPDLLKLAGAVFGVAWVGQFIGHHIEGRRPSFLTDLRYLAVGPLWVVAKLLRRLGMAW
jgi:uncharacterized membrane protein YGL010W